MKKLFALLTVAFILVSAVSCGALSSKAYGVDFDIPEGFVVSADNENLWLSPTYPVDSSNVNLYISNEDASFAFLSREVLEATLESSFKEQGFEIDCDVTAFEKFEIDGFKAIKSVMSYSLGGITLHQIQYLVDADRMYTITYTMVGENDWTDEFDASGASIKVLTK